MNEPQAKNVARRSASWRTQSVVLRGLFYPLPFDERHFVWFAMLAVSVVYVSRYALTNPFVDEWEFIPVLLQEKPGLPWLWELHNEHRFPLPRAIYLSLFRLTGNLRIGCFISLAGMSLLALGWMSLAARIRGRPSICDAVFPLLLMHPGQGENLYMGYQMCFMLMAVLACMLMWVMVKFNGQDAFRRAVAATLVGWLLLLCGAGGLAYGVAAAAWVALLAIRGGMKLWQRGLLLSLVAMTPLYIAICFQDYVRPGHHPPSAGMYESLRVGLQAQSMAFGPSATGLWPVIGIAVLLVATVVIALLASSAIRDLRSVGLLLFVLAGGAVSFGIGWGRSGFQNDMGFAWRYGWIVFPPVAAAYFAWLLRGGRVSIYGPAVLFIVAVCVTPVNVISAFHDAETKLLVSEQAWEADVRSGLTADQMIAKHFPNYHEPLRSKMANALRLMRDRRYTYYESLGREHP